MKTDEERFSYGGICLTTIFFLCQGEALLSKDDTEQHVSSSVFAQAALMLSGMPSCVIILSALQR
ncbi:MAG TPA: hypothetical protein VI873_01835, partial [Candidatus Peribacteraceae bacterium]|nr:hypothetical protein [Candidatus Peribacteraceae bacterium]